ncbi:MAG: 2-C-methyl-D-erythritol 4-phosphate cytidylyltransferase [Candidatus Gallimonas sp.]
MNVALVIAGGVGHRMGQDLPKQFLNVYDKPVIIYTLEAFQRHPLIDAIEVVCLDGWESILRAYCRQFNISKLENIVPGGENGQSSIRNGVFDIAERYSSDDLILIHDAIRPMVSEEIISDCIRTALKYGNAIAAIPCVEAMMKTEDGVSSSTQIPRDNLKRTQTPQAATVGELVQAHRDALARGITESVSTSTLFVELGKTVYFSSGSEKNVKLTTVEDIEIFKALLSAKRDQWLK